MKYLLLLVALLAPISASAFEPQKNPIQIVVSAAPGGPADQFARLFSEFLTTRGYPATVVNKPGANRTLGGNYIESITGNNYTLIVGTKSDSLINTIVKPAGIRYDETTYTPLGMIGYDSNVFLINKSQIHSRDITMFLEEYQANNKKINFGVPGIVAELAIRDFVRPTGIEPTILQFKSSSEVTAAVAAGTVQVGVNELTASLPMIRSGYVGALAITAPLGSVHRSPSLPNVEVVQEVNKKFNRHHNQWFGFFGPHDMKPEAVKFYSDMIVAWQTDPVAKEKIALLINPKIMDSRQFESFYRDQFIQAKKLLRSSE